MIEALAFLIVWWLWDDEEEGQSVKPIGWVELPWKAEVWNPDAKVTVRIVKEEGK